MATKHTDTCLQKAADDEPIFVLRAQDLSAPKVVRFWAEQYKADRNFDGDFCGPRLAKYDEAMALADRMEKWPMRKFPD